MHSLEPEYRELHSAGLVDEAATSRAIALERGEIFSVFEEVRFALYAAVAAITTGVGILVKENLDHIGPLTLILALALAAAACYGTAIRTHVRRQTRSIGGDYLLLLGALILSADLGYAESRFHWLGAHWSWYLLVLAMLHAVTAYRLDSRLVLSVALTSLAAWFGIDEHLAGLLHPDSPLKNAGIESLTCAGVILIWLKVHRGQGGTAQFAEVFEHYAANLSFWGAIVLSFLPETRFVGIGFLIALAAVSIRKGLRNHQEAFVIYGIVYTSFGLYYLEALVIGNALFASVCRLATVIMAVILLRRFRHRAKAASA